MLWVIVFHLNMMWTLGFVGDGDWTGGNQGLDRLEKSWWWMWITTGDMGVDVRH